MCHRLAIQEASAFIATLRGQHEDVRLSYTLQTARHNLRIAVQKANRFLEQVHEISFHCSAESELMRAAKAGVAAEIYTPDLHPLSDLVDQLTQNIAMARTYYIEFEEACNDVISTCVEAAQMCGLEVKRAGDNWVATVMIGAAVVTVSIVAGILFPGFGAAVVVGAVGGGAIATAWYLVHELNHSKGEFRRIQTQFDSLLGTAHSIKEEVNSVETVLVNVSGLLDSVILHQNNHESIVSVRVSLHRLSTTGSQIQQTVSSCRRSLQSKVNEL